MLYIPSVLWEDLYCGNAQTYKKKQRQSCNEPLCSLFRLNSDSSILPPHPYHNPEKWVFFFTRFIGLGTFGYRAGVWQRQWWFSVALNPTLFHCHVVSGEGSVKEEELNLSQKCQWRSKRASPEGLRKGVQNQWQRWREGSGLHAGCESRRKIFWASERTVRDVWRTPHCPNHHEATQLLCGNMTAVLQAAPPYGVAAR